METPDTEDVKFRFKALGLNLVFLAFLMAITVHFLLCPVFLY